MIIPNSHCCSDSKNEFEELINECVKDISSNSIKKNKIQEVIDECINNELSKK